jgi:hypothetical protein
MVGWRFGGQKRSVAHPTWLLGYDTRIREKGLKKVTVWLPEEKLNKLRGNITMQEFVENLARSL